jgi:hypothetical protein
VNASTSSGPPAVPGPDSTEGRIFPVPPEKPQAFCDQEDLLVRSALAGNPEALSSLARLPLTREEVQVVARLHGSGSRLLMGPEAN